MNHLEKILGKNINNKIKQDLEKLALPYPIGEMATPGFGCCTAFLSDYGLVIRMEKIETDAKEIILRQYHPLILQPLHSIRHQDYAIEICPGIKTGVSEDALLSLMRSMQRSKINFWDPQQINGGRIHDFSTKLPDQAVILDRNAVDALTDRINRNPGRFVKNDLQKQYAPLKHAFSNAAKRKYQTEALKEAYLLCREFKLAGKLICGWEDIQTKDDKIDFVRKAAVSYKPRVREHHQKILGISP